MIGQSNLFELLIDQLILGSTNTRNLTATAEILTDWISSYICGWKLVQTKQNSIEFVR